MVASKVMRVKEAREAASMRQADLAAAMGTTQSTVCMWETESALPRTRQLPLLAEVLGCSINDLFVPASPGSGEGS